MGNPVVYIPQFPKTPSLGCLPIRGTLLIVCAISLVASCISATEGTTYSTVSAVIGIISNSLVLFGVYKENACVLKWCQRLYFVFVVFSVIVLAVLPLHFACDFSSEFIDHTEIFQDDNSRTEFHISSGSDFRSDEYAGSVLARMFMEAVQKAVMKRQETKIRYIYGMVIGLVCEIALFIGVAFYYMVYVMIKRFKNYVMATNEFEKGRQPLV
ncbi:hypothetical protein CRE_28901 [Caenorhabditis remanei]|uniref:Uncharacterized protein n=1 Tax=Caenorhabditis remanei TaxID=31234 RepID=E3MXF3_CAERE|nr:hypothetical protein CRE_28901 [Caenorhabditis remanei]